MTRLEDQAAAICEIECSCTVPTPNEGHYLTARKAIEVVRGAIADEIEAKVAPWRADVINAIYAHSATIARGSVSPPLEPATTEGDAVPLTPLPVPYRYCCGPSPDGADPTACSWPDTDCYENGPAAPSGPVSAQTAANEGGAT